MVYVLDINGEPLMPTERHGKVRRLLRDRRAKVVRREPFTIKLLYEPETKVVQEVNLGVDTGSSKVGVAAVGNGKTLYAAEVTIRNDISKKMDRRRGARRARRTRKLRYRKPRFNNRRNSIKSGRFSPTMVSKINSHIREIEFVRSILPVKRLILETGTFDPHKLKNPGVRGWGYQKGPNYGFENSKAACLNRDNYTCQHCRTKKGTLHAHHIVYRSQGGADTLDNLITLCEECHKKLHKGELKDFEAKLKGKKKGNLKHATQMNSIRKQLLRLYSKAIETIETFGYVTKENRQSLGLDKSHVVDACVIASQGKLFNWNLWYFKKRHIPRQERILCKGIRGERKIPTGKVLGFRRYDKVQYLGMDCFVKGRRSSGAFVLSDINNKSIDFRPLGGKDNPSYKLLTRLNSRCSTLCIKAKTTVSLA